MKRYSLLVAFIICQLAVAQKNLTLEDIWKSRDYYPKYLYGLNSMNDGLHYTIQDQTGVIKYEYKTGNKVGEFTFGSLDAEDYTFSDDETKILISTQGEQIYRHSSRGYYHVYDVATKTVRSQRCQHQIESRQKH